MQASAILYLSSAELSSSSLWVSVVLPSFDRTSILFIITSSMSQIFLSTPRDSWPPSTKIKQNKKIETDKYYVTNNTSKKIRKMAQRRWGNQKQEDKAQEFIEITQKSFRCKLLPPLEVTTADPLPPSHHISSILLWSSQTSTCPPSICLWTLFVVFFLLPCSSMFTIICSVYPLSLLWTYPNMSALPL